MLLLLQAWVVLTVGLVSLLGVVVGGQKAARWTRRHLVAVAASLRAAMQPRRT